MAQLMPLSLTVSCFSKIQIGFTFLVPAHPGSPGKRAIKRVCVCVKRSLASCPLSECTGCHQKAHMSSETLLQQYPSALTWGCWLTKADLCNSHKVVGCQERNPFQQNDQWSFPLGVLIWTLWKIRLEKKCFLYVVCMSDTNKYFFVLLKRSQPQTWKSQLDSLHLSKLRHFFGGMFVVIKTAA